MWRTLAAFVLTRLLILLQQLFSPRLGRMNLRPWRPQAPSRTHQSEPASTSPPPILHPPRRSFTESHRRMYKLEKEENFRWIARLLASSSSRVLTQADVVSTDVQLEIADIGQYAELAHGSVDLEFVWPNLDRLVQKEYPLEGYDALRGSELVSVFHGQVASLQGFIAHRPEKKQLVIAISGTSSPAQALHDVDCRMVQYPIRGGNTSIEKARCKVHAGFWRLFQGLRSFVLENLSNAFKSLDVDEVVVTGHSLGAAMSFLFVVELLQGTMQSADVDGFHLPQGATIKLVGFGAPRLGNEALALFYRKLVSDYQEHYGKDKFQEYSVKGYNDGVPCLPPKSLGFRHLAASPLYLFHGRLFRIPPSESERSVFPVQLEDDALFLEYPLGGHNYYNNRDMEKTLRFLRLLLTGASTETDWEERHARYLAAMSQTKT